jgi:TPR repeat protein
VLLAFLGVALAGSLSVDDSALLDACAQGTGSACTELALRWAAGDREDRAIRLWEAGCLAGEDTACTALLRVLPKGRAQQASSAWRPMEKACENWAKSGACRLLAQRAPRYALKWLGHACTQGDARSCAEVRTRLSGVSLSKLWLRQRRGSLDLDAEGKVTVTPTAKQHVPLEATKPICQAVRSGDKLAVAYGQGGCEGLWLGQADPVLREAHWKLPHSPGKLGLHFEGDALVVRTKAALQRYRLNAEPEDLGTERSYREFEPTVDSRWLLGVTDLNASPPWGLVLLDLAQGTEVILDADALSEDEQVAGAVVHDGRVWVSTTRRLGAFDIESGEAWFSPVDLQLPCYEIAVSPDSAAVACGLRDRVAVLELKRTSVPWTVTPAPRPPPAWPVAVRSLERSVYRPRDAPEQVDLFLYRKDGEVDTVQLDATGTFQLSDVPLWGMQARADGWISTIKNPREWRVSLRRAATLRVRVVDQNGRAQAGARVVAAIGRWPGRNEVDHATTDARGRASLTFPASARRGQLFAQATGGRFADTSINADNRDEIELVLGTGKAKAWRFLDESGQPLVDVNSVPSTSNGRWRSDADGWLVAPQMPQRDDWYWFQHGERSLRVNPDGLEVVRVGTATIDVRHPNTHVRSVLYHADGATRPLSMEITDTGQSFGGLIAGTWAILSLDPKTHMTVVDVVEIPTGGQLEVVPTWVEGELHGRLLDTDGWPMAGATVTTKCVEWIPELEVKAEFGRCYDETDAAGRFHLVGLGGLGWTLRAHRKGASAELHVSTLGEDVTLQMVAK